MTPEKITRDEFRTLLINKQGFLTQQADDILTAMDWQPSDPDPGKNFFQIVTRMGKAIVRK
jgi:hypothetical protein